MRRFSKLIGKSEAECITTSNMRQKTEYVVNFASYSSAYLEIIDNAGIMVLKLLNSIGVKKVFVAGMDGYSKSQDDYFDETVSFDFSQQAEVRNELISKEIKSLSQNMKIQFVTPTQYQV